MSFGAKARFDIVGEQLYGHDVAAALGHDEVGSLLGRLDIHLVHWFEHIAIAVKYHLGCASALHTVACDYTYEPLVGLGIDKYFDVEHVAQHRVGKHEYTLDNHYFARAHRNGLGLACAGEIGVSGHLDSLAALQSLDVSDKERPLDGCRLVKIDFASLRHRNVAGVLVIGVLREYGDLTGREGVDYLVDDGGFA